jgi:hypothetical protein
MTKPRIVLEADVYDTLELSAYAFGGIGGDSYGTDTSSADNNANSDDPDSAVLTFVNEFANAEPMCAVGHAAFTVLPGNWWQLLPGGTVTVNDHAVEAINARKGKVGDDRYDRVTFEEWVKELKIVRGEQ